MKSKEKIEARRLRKNEGLSTGAIARKLGVSTSTVSLWVRDIKLSEEHYRKLSISQSRVEKSRKTRMENSKQNRLKFQNEGRRMAIENGSDKIFIAGCVAYWVEGAKCGRGEVSMTNSDPNMLKLFIEFLCKFFEVEKEDFLMFCRYYTDLTSVGGPEKYWIDQLELSKECLRKSCVNYYPKDRTVVKRKYSHGKLKYGTCRIKISSVEVMQKVYGAIQQLMEFDEPKWIDF